MVVKEYDWVVLLAEDDVGVRNMVRRVLERAGFRVLAAADIVEALTFAYNYSHPIDILLIDVDMPQIDGISLAEHIKKVRPEILVLMMSGWLHSAGVHDVPAKVLAKPFSMQSLLETIRDLILDAR